MKLLCEVGIIGSLVLVTLGGCSNAARDASKSDSAPVVQNITLTANTSPTVVGTPLFTSYTYFDTNNDAEVTGGSSIQWLRDGATIPGATGRLYTLRLADAGKTISAEVTPLAQTGSSPGLPVVSSAVTVAPANVALNVSVGLKQLKFSWAAVPGASIYRVSYNPDGATGFTVVSVDLSATNYDWDIAVHHINWPKAQFLLEACDSSGCLPSNSINALDVMVRAIGYFKASNTGGSDEFGRSVALSGDGLTLAVGAPYEDSAKTGVIPGAPAEAGAPDAASGNASGAVYLFTRSFTRSGAAWSQQAYVKASNTGAADLFGWSVALSADGNTLAVGAPDEDSATPGIIPGAPVETDTPDAALGDRSGAIYLFTRSGAAWSQQAYAKALNPGVNDRFGYSVALSGDGLTLAVGAFFEASSSTGIDSTPNESALGAGAVYVYTRSGVTWTPQAYVKASNTGGYDYFGTSVALSAEGNTLAVGASLEDSAKIGVIPGTPVETDTPDAALSADFGAVYVFTRSGGAWTQQAYVKSSSTGFENYFGWSVALSGDGHTLAVGAPYEGGTKTGITPGAPDRASTPIGFFRSGAVYVFTRSGATWSQQAYVKASNTGADDYFGTSLALSGDGNTLAVGAYWESSAKTGITPGAPDHAATPNDDLGGVSGAVYVFTRSVATWSQQAYVKASNTGAGDLFGHSVALNKDGHTLVVGAREASAATGVNNTVPGQSDNSAYYAGAVYLY